MDFADDKWEDYKPKNTGELGQLLERLSSYEKQHKDVTQIGELELSQMFREIAVFYDEMPEDQDDEWFVTLPLEVNELASVYNSLAL